MPYRNAGQTVRLIHAVLLLFSAAGLAGPCPGGNAPSSGSPGLSGFPAPPESPEDLVSSAPPESDAPPDELLAGNFEAAPVVVVLEVRSVETVRTFTSDDGRPGYVQLLVSGRVKKVYKGAVGAGEEIGYRFTAEHGGQAPAFPAAGDTVLAFLKTIPESGEYWMISEAAQFEYDESLEASMQDVVSGAERSGGR